MHTVDATTYFLRDGSHLMPLHFHLRSIFNFFHTKYGGMVGWGVTNLYVWLCGAVLLCLEERGGCESGSS